MYLHEWGPYLLQFSDHFGIQWNGLSYVLGFFFAFIMVRWLTLRQRTGVPVGTSLDLVVYCAIGVLLGGRLGYCLFYAPDLFIKFRADFPFWGVFALGDGGMSSFGGMLGIVVAATLFAINSGLSRLYIYDLVAFAAPLGLFFGRLANFAHGELIGKPVENSFPFSVKFPTEILHWPTISPEKLPELSSAVGLLSDHVTVEQWSSWVSQMGADGEAHSAVLQHVQALVEAMQNGSVEIKSAIMPMLAARHPSQLYSAAGEGLFLFFVMVILWFWPRKPGVMASTFLVLYSLIYMVIENYRMPDPMLGYGLLGLTRGQWLAGTTFIFGFALLFIWGRRETLPVSGWGQGHSVRIHRR